MTTLSPDQLDTDVATNCSCMGTETAISATVTRIDAIATRGYVCSICHLWAVCVLCDAPLLAHKRDGTC